jgi:hypothetical protein
LGVREIVFARLGSAFAILALVIACVSLYATMAYAVTHDGALRGRLDCQYVQACSLLLP